MGRQCRAPLQRTARAWPVYWIVNRRSARRRSARRWPCWRSTNRPRPARQADHRQRGMVQAGPLEAVRQPGDGGQARPQHGVAVQLHRQQTRRRHGQLPGANVLPRAQDDEETAKLLSDILPVVLEQADYESVYSDTWWRKLKQVPRQGHLLGPGAAGGPWGHRHPEHGSADALLGAGRGGHPGLGKLLLAGAGRQRPSDGPVAAAGGQGGQQRHHRGAVRQRPEHRHQRKERGGGLVLQAGEARRSDRGALLQVLQRRGALRQRERPGDGRDASTTTENTPLCSTRSLWKRTARRASGTST